MNYSTYTGDQADTLRSMASSHAGLLRLVPPLQKRIANNGVRVLSVTSGKGGVGKSSVVVNLAVALARSGQKVLIMDADLGLANIDVLLGLTPSRTMNDVFSGSRRLSEIMMDGPAGIKVVPAGSGEQRYTSLGHEDRLRLMDEMDTLEDDFDVVIIDTESGISPNVTYFNVSAQETMLVVTPDPASLTDVYALIKLLATRHGERHFKVLVNMARDSGEGNKVFHQLSQVVHRFLEVSLDYTGCVVRDERMVDANRRQKAVVELYPRSLASQCFTDLARNFSERPAARQVKGNIQFLFRRYFENSPAMRYV